MTNYSEMKAAELKLMARDAGVKNWWNLNKASLVEALTAHFTPVVVDTVVEGVKSVTINFTTGEVTLKMICEVTGHTPKRARKQLRRMFGAQHCRWVFTADEANTIIASRSFYSIKAA